MPLTIAHPAAVIPFRHSRLPLSALVVGTLAPDFEYFLHLAPRSDFSHTLPGLFLFCLPAGMAALWIFHRIWKPPMMATFGLEMHLPNRPFHFGPLPHFLMLCCEILIGALLHFIWDSFTHDYGWLVQNVEGLSRQIHVVGKVQLPLYLILQHISTLAGCSVLLFMAFHHRKWTWPALAHRWPLLMVVGWMTIAGGIALGMLVAGDVSSKEGLVRWLGCGQVVGTTVMVIVITFLCIVWHIRQRQIRPTQ